MIVLLSLISVIALFFIFLDRLRHRGGSGGITVGNMVASAGVAALFLLPPVAGHAGFRIGLGLIFLLYSFILLGIIPGRNGCLQWLNRNSYWAYAPITALLWSVSGIPPAARIMGVTLFMLLLIPTLLTAEKRPFSFMEEKYSQNVDKILELFHLLGGIFLFITVLVIASDRVRFFKKIVDYFF